MILQYHERFRFCEKLENKISGMSAVCRLLVLPVEVKKSLWAESDCKQLSSNKHQHGSSILKKERED